eukprot:Hpha_TRINITY_DN17306_c0_g1::TRINITY_DN17306_c0_g1_i1::g.138017::m.138017
MRLARWLQRGQSCVGVQQRWAEVGSSRLETGILGTKAERGTSQQSIGWRKQNPNARPIAEYERLHPKAHKSPAAVLWESQDFSAACFLKPRLDLSRRGPPSEEEAVWLYRALLKKAERQLVWTSMDWFRRTLRFEFTVTSRLAKDKLDLQRNMFEKGEWLLNNDLGGLR